MGGGAQRDYNSIFYTASTEKKKNTKHFPEDSQRTNKTYFDETRQQIAAELLL